MSNTGYSYPEYNRSYYEKHRSDPAWMAKRAAKAREWKARQKAAGIKYWHHGKVQKARADKRLETVKKKFLALAEHARIDFLTWATNA